MTHESARKPRGLAPHAAKKTSRDVPSWALDPLRRFFDYQNEVTLVLHLSIHGISLLRVPPKALRVLMETGDRPRKKSDLDIADAEAAAAAEELANGFPLLHRQALVSIWGAFETMGRDLVVSWLINDVASLEIDQIKRIKISIAQFGSMSAQERAEFLVDTLDRDLGASQKHGIDRLECLLKLLKIGGSLEAKTRRTIWELSQLRHVIVHRGGKVDRRFTKACPWYPAKEGDDIHVKQDDYGRYLGALASYVVELSQRIRVRLGVARRNIPKAKNRRARVPDFLTRKRLLVNRGTS